MNKHRSKRRLRRRYVLGALLAASTVLAGCRGGSDEVQGTGTLEVVEVDVSPMSPARVVKVWRNEGDTVRAGDTLVSLTQSALAGETEARRARVVAAEAGLRDLL